MNHLLYPKSRKLNIRTKKVICPNLSHHFSSFDLQNKTSNIIFNLEAFHDTKKAIQISLTQK